MNNNLQQLIFESNKYSYSGSITLSASQFESLVQARDILLKIEPVLEYGVIRNISESWGFLRNRVPRPILRAIILKIVGNAALKSEFIRRTFSGEMDEYNFILDTEILCFMPERQSMDVSFSSNKISFQGPVSELFFGSTTASFDLGNENHIVKNVESPFYFQITDFDPKNRVVNFKTFFYVKTINI